MKRTKINGIEAGIGPFLKKLRRGKGKSFIILVQRRDREKECTGGGLVAKLHIENVCPSEFKLSCEM